MTEGKKKVLVALDGSDYAMEAVRYLCRLPAKRDMDVVLFSVFSAIPEAYWDLKQDPKVAARVAGVRAWQAEKMREITDYMKAAAEKLNKAGFPAKNIKIKVQERKEGITRDILKEARKHYTAVMVGRKGAGRAKKVLWGSVTQKLMEKLYFLPLIVVSKEKKSAKVLIALDTSEGSQRAVSFAASILAGSGAEIELLHVIRLKDNDEVAQAEIAINKVFQDATKRFTEAGFPLGNITSRIITGVESRSEAIVKEAKAGRFGTIVVGRRGLSKVKEFSIGRVASRVAQLSTDAAVWVVN